MRILRICICLLLAALMLGCGVIATVELWTMHHSADYCHDTVDACGNNRVAVVLGCSKSFASGKPNAYFHGRMQAAADLWKSGRIRGIIVSGDNSDRYYNEPRDMRAALVRLGVPNDKIVSDFAGLRTFDSVVRTERIFRAGEVIFISQPAHVARAVAIARNILKNGAPAVKAYMEFLSGGCTKSPVDLLKIAGVNLESPQPIQDALDVMGEILDEMEKLEL